MKGSDFRVRCRHFNLFCGFLPQFLISPGQQVSSCLCSPSRKNIFNNGSIKHRQLRDAFNSVACFATTTFIQPAHKDQRRRWTRGGDATARALCLLPWSGLNRRREILYQRTRALKAGGVSAPICQGSSISQCFPRAGSSRR